MKIDKSSVIKAGGAASAVAIILGIISGIPPLGLIFLLCACGGGFLIPIGAGMLYGYFAPGEEEIGESALGGLLAGGAATLLYGIFRGLSELVFSIFDGGGIVDVLAASAFGAVSSVCGFGVSGLIFGAIGGLLWSVIQQRRGAPTGV